MLLLPLGPDGPVEQNAASLQLISLEGNFGGIRRWKRSTRCHNHRSVGQAASCFAQQTEPTDADYASKLISMTPDCFVYSAAGFKALIDWRKKYSPIDIKGHHDSRRRAKTSVPASGSDHSDYWRPAYKRSRSGCD
jgi:hypothetical protein